jgi:hypothetical protein
MVFVKHSYRDRKGVVVVLWDSVIAAVLNTGYSPVNDIVRRKSWMR